MDKCDFCEAEYFQQDRRVVALPRPSDPTELCAVMWGCGKCPHTQELPTAVEVYYSVENLGHWLGTPYLIVSV